MSYKREMECDPCVCDLDLDFWISLRAGCSKQVMPMWILEWEEDDLQVSLGVTFKYCHCECFCKEVRIVCVVHYCQSCSQMDRRKLWQHYTHTAAARSKHSNGQVMLDGVYQLTVSYSAYTGVPKIHCLFNLKVTISASACLCRPLSLDFLPQCSQWTLI